MNQPHPLFKNRCYWLDLKFTFEKLPGVVILFYLTSFYFILKIICILSFTRSRVKLNFNVNKALLPSESTLVLSLHELRLSPLIY